MYEKSTTILEVENYESKDLPINYLDLVEYQNLFKFLSFSYLACIFLFFFYFGGFNGITFHLMLGVSSLFLSYLVLFESNHFLYVLRKKEIKLFLGLLGFYFIYILFQYWYFSTFKDNHPIFGAISKNYFQYGYFYFLKEPLFIINNFLIFSALVDSDYYKKIAILFVRVLGISIALTALMHWFYDNGKLFWVFEPNAIFISERARWPFVNSNHCGAILASIFVFQVSAVLKRYKIFAKVLEKGIFSKRYNLAKNYSEFFRHKNFKNLLMWLYQLIFSFVILLAVLATASRANWAVILFVIFLFSLLISPRKIKKRAKNKVFSIKEIFGNPFNSYFIKLVFIYFIGICSLLFFISGRGSDIVVNRASYALSESTSDLRFTFYSHTKPMLQNNFMFGIGFKNWNEAFKEVKPTELSQINPAFLHSDPYQIFVELGFLGTLPLIIFTFYMIIMFVKVRKIKTSRKLTTSFIAIVALFFSSLFGFPFRSPAIMAYFMLICALFINELESRSGEFI